MKKRFSIIALLLVLVVTFVTFGCKNAEDLNLDDVDKWNDLQVMCSKDYTNSIAIMADNEPIDWWIITDEKGVVLEPNKDYTFETYDVLTSDPVSTPSESCDIPKGQNVCLKFKTDKAIVVWIHQQTVAPKEYTGDKEAAKGTKDFRGRVDIKWADQGYEVKASKYREEVSQVGVVKLTCNETGSVAQSIEKDIGGTKCYGGAWSGNYEITEVWPLKQNGAGWEAAEGLKFILDDPIEEGGSRRFVYPAGNSIFAIRQPSRFTDKDDSTAVEKQKNWYWCAAFYTNLDIEDSKDVDGEPEYYGPVPAHGKVDAFSRECGAYFSLTTANKGNLYKSALGTTYIVDEFFEGSSEK